MAPFIHIEVKPQIFGGKPCIKGTSISVESILELVASGASLNDILSSYQHPRKEDDQEAILYAAQLS